MKRVLPLQHLIIPVLVLITTTAAILMTGCSSSNNREWTSLMADTLGAEPSQRVTGRVRHMDVEGGVYVIRALDGTNYNPRNLPVEFQEDGMPVEADIRVKKDMASTAMVGPVVDIIQIRQWKEKKVVVDENPLVGTMWRLDDLAGTPILAGTEATLEFAEDGKVAGKGSCNSFFGTVRVSGERISFRDLGSTLMACADSVNLQERQYLEALDEAERYTIEPPHLLIYFDDSDKPLRLIRKGK